MCIYNNNKNDNNDSKEFKSIMYGKCFRLFENEEWRMFLFLSLLSDSDKLVCDRRRMDVGLFVDYERRKCNNGCGARFCRFHQRSFYAG